MTVYASWNGATEVATWAIWGAVTATGLFQRIGSMRRHGFESHGLMPFSNYVYAVALDAQMVELGRTEPIPVAVLDGSEEVAQAHCGTARCPIGFNYTAHARRQCPPAQLTEELEPDLSVQGDEPGNIFGMHCDPCFGQLQSSQA